MTGSYGWRIVETGETGGLCEDRIEALFEPGLLLEGGGFSIGFEVFVKVPQFGAVALELQIQAGIGV